MITSVEVQVCYDAQLPHACEPGFWIVHKWNLQSMLLPTVSKFFQCQLVAMHENSNSAATGKTTWIRPTSCAPKKSLSPSTALSMEIQQNNMAKPILFAKCWKDDSTRSSWQTTRKIARLQSSRMCERTRKRAQFQLDLRTPLWARSLLRLHHLAQLQHKIDGSVDQKSWWESR